MSADESPRPRRRPFPFSISLAAAPMVGASDLAFRLLCRRYGASVCYTEMIYADAFAASEEYRQTVFFSQLDPHDRPLVVQFAANDPTALVAAAALVAPHCDAVDLNLGCPQKRAQVGGYGAYLLDEPCWEQVFGLIRSLSSSIPLPTCCKVRLLPSLARTIRFCRGLEAAGCSLLAVHGRQRGSPTRRRAGPADLSAIRAIKRALSIPVLSNGNVRAAAHLRAAARRTRADGVMVGEALLRYPALFALREDEWPTAAQRRALLREYIALAQEHPPPELSYVRAHVLWQLGRDGSGARLRFKWLPRLCGPRLRDRLVGASSASELLEVCERSWEAHDEHERCDTYEETAEKNANVADGKAPRPLEADPRPCSTESVQPVGTTRTIAYWQNGGIRFERVPNDHGSCEAR